MLWSSTLIQAKHNNGFLFWTSLVLFHCVCEIDWDTHTHTLTQHINAHTKANPLICEGLTAQSKNPSCIYEKSAACGCRFIQFLTQCSFNSRRTFQGHAVANDYSSSLLAAVNMKSSNKELGEQGGKKSSQGCKFNWLKSPHTEHDSH